MERTEIQIVMLTKSVEGVMSAKELLQLFAKGHTVQALDTSVVKSNDEWGVVGTTGTEKALLVPGDKQADDCEGGDVDNGLQSL